VCVCRKDGAEFDVDISREFTCATIIVVAVVGIVCICNGIVIIVVFNAYLFICVYKEVSKLFFVMSCFVLFVAIAKVFTYTHIQMYLSTAMF